MSGIPTQLPMKIIPFVGQLYMASFFIFSFFIRSDGKDEFLEKNSVFLSKIKKKFNGIFITIACDAIHKTSLLNSTQELIFEHDCNITLLKTAKKGITTNLNFNEFSFERYSKALFAFR